MWGEGCSVPLTDQLGPQRWIELTFGDLTFSSNKNPGPYPRWQLATLKGWWDGAMDDSQLAEVGRGARVVKERLGARQVSWSGSLKIGPRSRNLEDMMAEFDTFRSLKSDRVIVDELDAGHLREAAVTRKVQAEITPVSSAIAVYSVVLSCEDPLLYSGDELPVGPAKNIGDEVSRPLVTIPGPTSVAPVVTIGSRTVAVGRALTSSETAVVDCAEGEVWINQSRVFPTVGAWPVILPGQTATVSVTGTGAATVRRVSAWR